MGDAYNIDFIKIKIQIGCTIGTDFFHIIQKKEAY